LRRFADDPASAAELQWKIDILRELQGSGFRTERPLVAGGERWVVDGWTAWSFVTGRPATCADAPAVLDAVEALHAALAPLPYRPVLTPLLADRAAWDEEPLPRDLPAPLAGPLERLAALRRPLPDLRPQLIHGDLHYTNVLIAPAQPPAFIDWGLYWRPPEFAAAIAAYWLGPNLAAMDVLRHFARVPHLEQLLVRVAMRQLLFFVDDGPPSPSALREVGVFVRSAELVAQLF
jgi:Ser/Thr protein kinase RdoA (MazF antagonist)